MEKDDVVKALSGLREQSKRNFIQSYDLIINLKNLDIKTQPVDFFFTLPHSKGKKVRIAAFVDQQLAEQAAKNCDTVIRETDFLQYKEKQHARKLAEGHDYFLAQANLMPKVATTFGKVLGTKGKMPNPKLGCVVPATANLEPLIRKLACTVRLQAKKGTNLQCMVGKDNQPEEEVVENIITVYNAVVKHLPNEMQNVKSVLLKTTMGKPVRL